MAFPLVFFEELLCKLKCVWLADSCLPRFTPSAEVTLQEAEQGTRCLSAHRGKIFPRILPQHTKKVNS